MLDEAERDAARQATLRLAVLAAELQEGLRIGGVAGTDTGLGEGADDGVALRGQAVEEALGAFAVFGHILLETIGVEDRYDGVDQHQASGGGAEGGLMRRRGIVEVEVRIPIGRQWDVEAAAEAVGRGILEYLGEERVVVRPDGGELRHAEVGEVEGAGAEVLEEVGVDRAKAVFGAEEVVFAL